MAPARRRFSLHSTKSSLFKNRPVAEHKFAAGLLLQFQFPIAAFNATKRRPAAALQKSGNLHVVLLIYLSAAARVVIDERSNKHSNTQEK
jgi:hypothetical protein